MLSKNELVEFSQLPDLQSLRSQLCSVLQSAGLSLVRQLQQGQQILVANLDKHVELQNQPPEEQDKTES